MATIVNDRDVELQATSPRLLPVDLPDNIKVPALKGVNITAPTNIFKVDAAGTTVVPTSILLTANLVQISGTVTWTVTSGTATLTGSGNSRTVTYATMSTDAVTVQASVTDGGTTYTAQFTVNKVSDGTSGTDGRRSASGYVYYGSHSSSNPGTPSATNFNFDTGAFTGLTSGWSSTFTAPSPTGATNAKYWAARYNVSENTAGGTKTITFSTAFNWQNFDGLVTFTNLATNSGTTFIDGANITTGTLSADRIKAGTANGSQGSLDILGMNAILQVNRTSTTLLPAAYVYDTWSGATTPSLWVSQDATSGPSQAIQFDSKGTSTITLLCSSRGTSSGSAKFYNYLGTGSTTSKEFWAAPGSYSGYSPTGKGVMRIEDGFLPFTGAHIALAPMDDDYELGDIVIDVDVIDKPDVNNVLTTVARSSKANERAAIGVVSAVRQLVGSFPEELRYDLWWQFMDVCYLLHVNGLGEGQVNVCGANGDIQKGDLIVCSPIRGKGMKQDDDCVRAYTVARARESVTFDHPTQVKQIACIYVCG
jgi:hypothetical protein